MGRGVRTTAQGRGLQPSAARHLPASSSPCPPVCTALSRGRLLRNPGAAWSRLLVQTGALGPAFGVLAEGHPSSAHPLAWESCVWHSPLRAIPCMQSPPACQLLHAGPCVPPPACCHPRIVPPECRPTCCPLHVTPACLSPLDVVSPGHPHIACCLPSTHQGPSPRE